LYDLPYLWLQERSYIATVEAFIASASAALPLNEDDRLRLRDEPAAELDVGVSFEHFIEQTEVFPNILRRSVFLSTMILTESVLDQICDLIQYRARSPISVRELRGSGLVRAASYIHQLAGFQISSLPQWPEIRRLQEIRNILTHSNGAVASSRLADPLRRYVAGTDCIDLIPQNPEEDPPTYRVVRLRSGFAEHVVDILEAWTQGFPKDITQAS
jgi:hypothetical protein